MDQFPLGVEFHPTHEEVIRYLQRKLDGKPVLQGTICNFDVYSQHPKNLPGDFEFFFTPRHRGSGNNARRSIAIVGKQSAYWHTNDKINIFREPHEPEEKPVLVGQMTAFSFKIGNAGTDWLMHEYLLPEVPGRFQESAICKVRNKREDRINANKRKGKQMLEVPATSGYAGGSDFDSRTSTSKRRKINDQLVIRKVTPGQVREEFGFMPEEKQLYLNNISNVGSFTSGYDREASTTRLGYSCNQVTIPLPSDEVHEKSSLMRPFYEEFNQDIQSLKDKNQLYNLLDEEPHQYKSSVLHEEEDALPQETVQRLLEEGSDFVKGNPIALDNTDDGLWYVGNDDHNPINEVNGDDDTQNDGGEMIQDDEPSAVLSFLPQQQQILHHSSAAETLPQQPLVSQLSTDDQFSVNDLPVFIPGLQLSNDDQFSIDDLPLFYPGLQFFNDDWETYNNGIPELSNLVAEDYSIW